MANQAREQLKFILVSVSDFNNSPAPSTWLSATWSSEVVRNALAPYFVIWEVDRASDPGVAILLLYNDVKQRSGPVSFFVHPITNERVGEVTTVKAST